MTPLKYSKIPKEAKTLGIYIDGFYVSFETKPFIKDSIIYLPIREVISNIDNDVEELDCSNYQTEKIQNIDFVEALYFEKEL